MTGVNYWVYAKPYNEAATHLNSINRKGDFDPVIYQLFCQFLELHLKGFLWLVSGKTHKAIRTQYDHSLRRLWADSKRSGTRKYVAATPLRERVIKLVREPDENKRFVYLNLSVIFRGYKKLRSEPNFISPLKRLNSQLTKELRHPIMEAAQN
jgi:hypothetical protein